MLSWGFSDYKYMIYDLICLFSQVKTAYIWNISALRMSKHSETSLHLGKNELLEALISNNLFVSLLLADLCVVLLEAVSPLAQSNWTSDNIWEETLKAL